MAAAICTLSACTPDARRSRSSQALCRFAWILALCLHLCCAALFAQSPSATLTGRVTDQTGAAKEEQLVSDRSPMAPPN
jgi:hypothetical protein